MRKHWLFTTLLAIALCVICFVLFPTEAKAASVDDLSFKLNDDGQSYTVSDCSESASGALEIPATYNGKPVTTIGNDAFCYCDSLESITIPNSVTSIGHVAFENCSSLTNITIPDGVTSIGNYAFQNCSSLTNITIPDGVTSIGYSTFKRCSSLTSITIPDSVTSIDWNTFSGCSSLTSITIPNGVTKIGDLAFYDCESLTSVTIPDSVTSIGSYAFYNCSSLTSITIPDSVTIIGSNAFDGCSDLSSITIPNSATRIGESAFYDCSSLTRITIPDGVTKIGYSAFRGCSSLTSITIPDSVTSIGNYAFRGCSSLTRITIPDSVTSIGDSAFYDCSSLTSVIVPETVASIGNCVFDGCRKLNAVMYYGTNKSWNTLTIGSNNSIPVCWVEYKVVNGGAQIWNCDERAYGSLTLPKTLGGYPVTAIADDAFNHCEDLSDIIIPNGVTSIGDSAFSGCSSLTSITIPDSVTSIGDSAFYDCSSLTRITIPDGVTSIGEDAFRGCSSLTSITIPNSVTSIDWGAFFGCSSLTGITIPNSVTSINWLAFHTCSSLTSITIPDSVTRIGEGVFYDCRSLVSVTIPISVTAIEREAFYNCDNLTDVYYAGAREQWEQINIGSDNGDLTSANIRFGNAGVTKITSQPKTAKVKVGATAKFTVKAAGTGLTYQWQSSSDGKTWKNCSSSSAKKAAFTFTAKTSHSSNYYRCKVTDSSGNTVYTDAVRLYVLGVTTQPKTQKVEVGEKVKFTVAATGAGKTYQWQFSTDGKTWKNCSSSSAKKATFTFTGKTSHSSNYYRCRIKDNAGNTVYTDAVRLYVLGITEQPVSKTVTKGKTAKFEVEATGASKVYQWQVSTDGGMTWKNCSSSSAKKATFTFTSKTTHNGNYYRCRVKDNGGNTVYTAKVKLTVK